MSYKYFIHTFGCQSNKSDSERIAGDFEARGITEASDWRECDFLVVNTCAIRQRAEDRAKGFLLNVVEYFDRPEVEQQRQQQQRSPRPKIILTGCMTHHGSERLLEILPMVDEILPINEVGFNIAAIRKDKKHAWVPISVGCNSFCSYCIVPYSRGREKSRPEEDILAEVSKLVKEGYEELTLLGMNVNSWGLEKVGVSLRKKLLSDKKFTREDLPSNQSQYLKPSGTPPFVKLLQQVSAFPEIKKIRFMSSNPWDFHDELIAEIGRNKKIDRYVHLPIQSGSDAVLKRMNRGYTTQDYLQLLEKLQQADPEIVVGTDIIVGFPGETDQEFAETVELTKKIKWPVGFVAIYSPRPGTASWRLYEDDIPYSVKKERWEILDQIINKDHLDNRPKIV